MVQVRGDDKDDPTTYLVTFDDDGAKYLVTCSMHIILILICENDLLHVCEHMAFLCSFCSLFLLS